MRAEAFHAMFRAEGERALAPLGFRYAAKAWHLCAPERQLSFCPEDTKYGIGFAVKYLTLALWHLTVEPPPSVEFKPRKNNSWLCPVRISPAVLRALVESGFDLSLWDCPPVVANRAGIHLPLYYGGPDRWVLADPEASPEENRSMLLHCLGSDGIDYLDESVAHENLRGAFEDVRDYGLEWADFASPVRVAALMERHIPARDGHFGLDQWFPRYRDAARAKQGER